MPVHQAKAEQLITGVPATPFSVRTTRLPGAIQPHPASNLDPVDKDLALRLLSDAEQAEWADLEALGLIGALDPGTMQGKTLGSFRSVLEDDLGKVLSGVVLPSGGRRRWYVVPPGCSWQRVVEWLVSRAIRTHVPKAIYRATPGAVVAEAFLTPTEKAARDELAAHEAEATDTRLKLEGRLAAATSEAEAIRSPLLFDQGHELKKAVARALSDCGFTTEDLDETLAGGASADLLAQWDGKYWLVEVTASSKAAKEREWGNLSGHLKI